MYVIKATMQDVKISLLPLLYKGGGGTLYFNRAQNSKAAVTVSAFLKK